MTGKMKRLLLEIHTEEIPAGYIEPALEALAAGLLKRLENARIDHGAAETLGTPRRLAVSVSDVAVHQRPMSAEVIGPPQKVGFDENGAPTVAAKKFAEKMGLPIEKIQVKETPKGCYLCAVKTEEGYPSRALLKAILPEVITSIPFPKTMRWGDLHTSFARPIRSILALLGGSVISFALENLKSGRYTFGHRFLNPGRIRISDACEYVEALRSASVLVDIGERRRKAAGEVSSAAAKLDGRVLDDPELMDIVKNLVEYPVAVAGRFDRKFLELPPEILITAMREHQKYFAVIDRSGELMPHFIALNNTPVKEALAAKGHERVLRARLEDARFFYRADLKTPLERFIQRLDGVLFQAKLGSMRGKIQRVEKLTGFLADALSLDEAVKRDALKAARLSKADLVSQVVGEFPRLQGVMGRIYAAAAGEPEAVSTAVEEHYRPTYSGGALPETLAGSLLGVADKADTICGCFSIGLVPTGASDPYALRRQSIGLIQIALKNRFSFSLRRLIGESLSLFDAAHSDAAAEEVYLFLRNRMSQMLVDEGFPKDVVSAVVSISADNVSDVWSRVRALTALKSAPDFEPLAIAFKRVVNIIRQAGQKGQAAADKEVKPELFEDSCETELNAACDAVSRRVSADLGDGRYDRALQHMATLRKPVDLFFDGVMVLTDDSKIRSNRLALLNRIAGLFETVADFSKITT
jgi:glycyl-tRNA synthetase beta chain